VQQGSGRKPSSLHRPQGNAKKICRRLLGKSLVVEQRDHLAFMFRQLATGMVKRGPAGEIIGFAAAIERRSRLISRPVVCVMVGSNALRTEVVPLEVDKLTADLCARQVEEVAGRLNLRLRQRPIEPHECILLDIIGRLPSPQRRIVLEHVPRQPQQPIIGMLEQPFARTFNALPHIRDKLFKLHVGRGTRGHESPSVEGKFSQFTSRTPRVTSSSSDAKTAPHAGHQTPGQTVEKNLPPHDAATSDPHRP
jgi:hypothetical protein